MYVVAQALSYSGQPGYECKHLQNVKFVDLFTDQLPLSENKLDEMKGLNWISARRKKNAWTSKKVLQKAQQASCIVYQQEKAIPADIFTFQFLVTKLNIAWCGLGRVRAPYNKTRTVLVPKFTTKDLVCVSIESIR